MKILISVLVNLICTLHLINGASVTREFTNDVVRVKRFDEEMMSAGVQAAAGLATSFMDVMGKGGAAKDERDFQADIPFASFKTAHKSEMSVGDTMADEYRRRKRSPCGKKTSPATTIAPPGDELEARRKRQAVNDPDNVRPQFDGKPEIQSFLDSFVELAKKIGNLFVPSDPNYKQTRQQEMDDRY